MKIICKICGTLFNAIRVTKRFCSTKCVRENYKLQLECSICHRIFIKRKDKVDENSFCPACKIAKIDRSGSNNPAWRGGHAHWQAGKFGKDKDGLSWRKQRLLAWERDNYACIDCGKKPEKRKVDVHHINPYRISQSHALDNLICLCQKCHKRRDANENALWDGKTFGEWSKTKQPPKPKCVDCQNKRVLNQDGRCLRCKRKNIDVPLAKRLYNEGKTMIEIGKILNVSRIMVFRWLKENYEYVDKKRGPNKKKGETEVNVPNVLP